MKGSIAAHLLAAKANNTPPPRHMAVKNYDPKARKTLDFDAFMDACAARDVDPADMLALALTDEMREKASESGMTMKEQAALIIKIRDKEIASKKAIEVSGNPDKPVVTRVEMEIIDPKNAGHS